MSDSKKYALASIESMYRVFTVPEEPNSTLSRIDEDISQNLFGFLQKNIVAEEKDLSEVEKDFADSVIPEKPTFVSDQADFLLNKLVSQSVHTASPSFVGHMTSALPYFMIPLSKIMIALNQNLVKTETSKAFTPLERQVLGMIHRLIYDQTDFFYKRWMHDADHALGVMCSGGTIANITSLWVARNRAFPPKDDFKGVSREGIFKALKFYNYDSAAILISKRGHYSMSKAADILGIGRDQLISIETDSENKISLPLLEKACQNLKVNRIKIMAIIGIAGTTETGNVDPLDKMADIARQFGAHFHVDAAWGGPSLFSKRYKGLLKGIERADSVTIDAHKQLYVPMGAGLAVFKNPAHLSSIEHHAQYVIRKGSKDLGSNTLEGSRPGMAMLIHSGLKIIGRNGYEILIDQGIDKAKAFARLIKNDNYFELISEPELNILTYRYCPPAINSILDNYDKDMVEEIQVALDETTKIIQKTQRERGRAFVSRTKLEPEKYQKRRCVVFRVVLANPLTTIEILSEILEEQKQIAKELSLLSPFIAIETSNTNQVIR
jgi:glutamate decarboxylase